MSRPTAVITTAPETHDTVGERLKRIEHALSLIKASIVTIAASHASDETIAVPGVALEALTVGELLNAMGAAAVDAEHELLHVIEGAPSALAMPAPAQ